MTRVALQTAQHELVVHGVIPPFNELPEVIGWGDRVFKLRAPNTSDDTAALYTEVFAVALVQYDKELTFNQLVAEGRARTSSDTWVNELPWSFTFHGCPFTHENDDRYLIIIDGKTVEFDRGDTLVVPVLGQLSVRKAAG